MVTIGDYTLQPGDLIFVRGKDWISHEIEEVSRSRYSHVAGYVGNGKLIEAQGFRHTGPANVSEYVGAADVYTCDDLSDERRDALVLASLKMIGAGYDYELIFWEWLRLRCHLVLPFIERGRKRDCMTLWRDLYRDAAGIDLTPGITYPTPGEGAASASLRYIGSY